MKIAAVCVVKNAEGQIAEWIAYQLVIGFDTVILLDNASTDSTAEVIQRFKPQFDVRLIDWPMTGGAYQRIGYEYACWLHRFEFDWCACIDADEFIATPQNRSLRDMLSELAPSVSAMALPWAMFGSSGLLERPSDLVIASYLYRAEESFVANRHIKSIVRPDKVRQCITPHHFSVDGRYVTNAGSDMESMPLTDETLDFSAGRINHYFVQSRACWEKKLARGYNDTVRNPDEFYVNDRNEIFDDAIAYRASAVREILSTVKLI
jgi:glycosyltransferase involved in cell wall biosynthesis